MKIHNKLFIWSKINKKEKNECWEWMGYILSNGYGQICINYKRYLVHRLIYELTHGPIPDNLLVCHTCDNRKCCNPNHLFLGTGKDNMMDKVFKMRQSKGETFNCNKLILKDIIDIRLLYRTGKYSQRKLGKQFNISQCQINNILLNKAWRI